MAEEQYIKALRLQQIMSRTATGTPMMELADEYYQLRGELVADLRIRPLLPDFVISSRDLPAFWNFIKFLLPTYQERRTFLQETFNPLLSTLEGITTNPAARADANNAGNSPSGDERTCFVIMPFSEPFNSYYTAIIATAITNAGLQPLRADEITKAGAIIDQIWMGIRTSAICVAELTGKNGNVMYELGLAHALGKPVITLVQSMDDIPFDLKHLRHIVYSTSGIAWEARLRASLEAMLSSTIDDPESAVIFK